MKRMIIIAAVSCSTALTSCYTLEYSVGKGAQGNTEVKGKNHYVVSGLVRVGGKTPADLAGSAKDYDVKITHSFVDGLLSCITGELYTPTTVIVKK